MKLGTQSSTIKKRCIILLSLLFVFGLTTASATNSTVASGQPDIMSAQVATINAHFDSPKVTAIDRDQLARRTRRGGKKFGKKGKKYGGYSKVTKKFKCATTTTPMKTGGIKVTKKCIHQFIFGNDIKTANGFGRTRAPSAMPSNMPSINPTWAPTIAPTFLPTSGPTVGPTTGPTAGPTTGPTFGPTSAPTRMEVLISTLPDQAHGSKISSKTAVGALVGGVLGFVVLAAGAKAVETAWRRKAASSDDSNHLEEEREQA